MKKTYNINVINFPKYIILLLLSLLILIPLVFISSSLIGNISENNKLIVIILFTIFYSILMTKVLLKLSCRNLKIEVENDLISFIDGNSISQINIEDIDSYKLKSLFYNYPIFSINSKNGKKIQFRLRDKFDENLDDFIAVLDSRIKS